MGEWGWDDGGGGGCGVVAVFSKMETFYSRGLYCLYTLRGGEGLADG